MARVQRKLKKKVLKKINPLNVVIMLCCIGIGYLVAYVSGQFQGQTAKAPIDEITESAARIADSFELYNQKKFKEFEPVSGTGNTR